MLDFYVSQQSIPSGEDSVAMRAQVFVPLISRWGQSCDDVVDLFVGALMNGLEVLDNSSTFFEAHVLAFGTGIFPLVEMHDLNMRTNRSDRGSLEITILTLGLVCAKVELLDVSSVAFPGLQGVKA